MFKSNETFRKASGIFLAVSFLLFLYFYLLDLFHYKINIDDQVAAYAATRLDLSQFVKFYTHYANGRWFSHLISACTFQFLKCNYHLYAAYLAFHLLLFVGGASFLFFNFSKSILKKPTGIRACFQSALGFTISLYFFLFEGRSEIWTWVSSVHAHLLSVTLSFFLFGILLLDGKMKRYVLPATLLSLCLGGLNEVNAAAILVCLILFALYHTLCRINGKQKIYLSCFAVLGLIIGLFLNYWSGGTYVRLAMLPDFKILQAFKNTLHTLLLPVLHFQMLPAFITGAVIFRLTFPQLEFKRFDKSQLQFVTAAAILFLLVIFLHCLALSDLDPPRGEIWDSTFFLSALLLFWPRKTLPIQSQLASLH